MASGKDKIEEDLSGKTDITADLSRIPDGECNGKFELLSTLEPNFRGKFLETLASGQQCDEEKNSPDRQEYILQAWREQLKEGANSETVMAALRALMSSEATSSDSDEAGLYAGFKLQLLDEIPSGELSAIISARRNTGERLKYDNWQEVGRGGQAVVYRCHDIQNRRLAAIKHICHGELTDNVLGSIIMSRLGEKRVAPAIYGSWTEGEQLFIAMEFLEGKTLADLIHELSGIPPDYSKQIDLLNIMEQICLALDSAHQIGIPHADLKPVNIFIKPSTLTPTIMDWGLFSRKTPGSKEVKLPGTLDYMAPERYPGQGQKIDFRIDIFSLGIILYEMLVGEKPFYNYRGQIVERGNLNGVINGKLIGPRQMYPQLNLPEALEQIILKATQRNPQARYQSPRKMYADIHQYILRAMYHLHEKEKAMDCLLELQPRLQEYENSIESFFKSCEEQVRNILNYNKKEIPSGLDENGQTAWLTQDAAEKDQLKQNEDNLVKEHEKLLEQWNNLFFLTHNAHLLDPENEKINAVLIKLYFYKLLEAERQGESTKNYIQILKNLHYEHNDDMVGVGKISLNITPADAEIILNRYVEDPEKKVLKEEPIQSLCNVTNTCYFELPVGKYVITVNSQDYHSAKYPFKLKRGDDHLINLNLIEKGGIPDGFIHIPASPFESLGPQRFSSLRFARIYKIPRPKIEIGDFAIAEDMVTMREYIIFLNDILKTQGKDEAFKLMPKYAHIDGSYVEYVENGEDGSTYFRLKTKDEEGFDVKAELPVHSISYYDAMTYCEWFSEKTGLNCRLPTENEWCKSASGDGRKYPWGDEFDPELCNTANTNPFEAKPVPVGSFELDKSPYGVRDMGGNMMEWTLMQEGETASYTKGGSWGYPAERSSVEGVRTPINPAMRYTNVSFRLVCEEIGR